MQDDNNKEDKNPKPMRFNFNNNRFALFFLILLLGVSLVFFLFNDRSTTTEIAYSAFQQYLDKGQIEEVTIVNHTEIRGRFTDRPVR